MLTLCSISLFALKVTHFVLFHDVRGCLSGTSFQATISQRLESHPASIETGGLQAMDNCLIFTCTYNLCDCYNLFYTRLFSVSSYVRNSVEIDWRRENNKKKFMFNMISTKLKRSCNSEKMLLNVRLYKFLLYFRVLNLYSIYFSYISRNILYIYLLCISDPESYVVETEELSSNGLKNADIVSHIYNRT